MKLIALILSALASFTVSAISDQRITLEDCVYQETTEARDNVVSCGADLRIKVSEPIPGLQLVPTPTQVPDKDVIWSLQERIEHLPVGPLDQAIAQRIFGRARHYSTLAIQRDPFGGVGKVLSIQFRKGMAGIGTDQTPSGFQSRIAFDEVDDLTMTMDIGVDKDWITPKGVHMPHFKSTPFAASRKIRPDIWAAFFQLYGNNDSIKRPAKRGTVDDSIWMYYYNQDKSMGAWPYKVGGRQVQLVRGGYARIKQRLKLNEIGQADGAFQAWYAGNLAIDKQSQQIRAAGPGIREVVFGFWSGGRRTNHAEWGMAKDQIIYVRDFVLSIE